MTEYHGLIHTTTDAKKIRATDQNLYLQHLREGCLNKPSARAWTGVPRKTKMTKDEKLEEIVADTFTELHRSEVAIANAINTNPKRRGELLAEYTRRILRIARKER